VIRSHMARAGLASLWCVCAVLGARTALALQDCVPGWADGVFCQQGTDDRVNAAVSGAVGSGDSLLYIGGRFDAAGCADTRAIAAWDGQEWSEISGGVAGEVNSMIVFDDGSGAALYVGGSFASAGGVPAENIARWDGNSWSSLGGGIQGRVLAMAIFDDGRGPALYAAGDFGTADGQPANNIARWSGTRWETLGSGLTSAGSAGVGALAVYDDGSGEALYVGGSFTQAGGRSAQSIARWDGLAWDRVGFGTTDSVAALEVYDDGSGPVLYAGGNFFVMSGVIAEGIARWDGNSWSALGSGMGVGVNGYVSSLQVFEEDGVPVLMVGGNMNRAGGMPVAAIARWGALGWSTVDSGLTKTPSPAIVEAMVVHDDGAGPALFAVGTSDRAGGQAVRNVARWDGESWSSERTLPTALNDSVAAFEVFDEGDGLRLFAGGDFEIGGAEPSQGVARWDGQVWSSVKEENVEGVEGIVRALAVFDDGSGSALYVGGVFNRAGEQTARNIARWDGEAWTPVGQGFDGPVLALAVYDDGTGPALYAGGDFEMAGQETVRSVARLEDGVWRPLVVDGVAGMNDFVSDMHVFDDGRGPGLFITGSFNQVGEQVFGRIVRWDGTAWSGLEGPMGEGLDRSGSGGLDGFVLEVYDDGRGDALYVGGEFDLAGGRVVNRIARWDGVDWEPLSGPTEIGVGERSVISLLAFDDGSGEKLYAGGLFQTAGGIAAGNIARWDGLRWESMPTATGPGLGTGLDSEVWALAGYDAGDGDRLYAGGRFTRSTGSPSDYTAVWVGCPGLCIADFDGDGELTLFDFLEFSNAFSFGEPRADLDGDGRFTLFDFLLFSNEFDAGCP
jgi:hypothetical protein